MAKLRKISLSPDELGAIPDEFKNNEFGFTQYAIDDQGFKYARAAQEDDDFAGIGTLSRLRGTEEGNWKRLDVGQEAQDEYRRKTGRLIDPGRSTLTPEGVTIDPALTAEKEKQSALAASNLRKVQESRKNVIGDRSTFVGRKTSGLRDSIARSKEQLSERLQKTGVTGEFGEQSKETLKANADQKLASGELLASNELASLEGNFDLMEGGAAELLNKIDINQFVQDMEARGLSQELKSKLLRIERGQDALSGAASQRKRERLGQVVMLASVFSSSRTFKYDMESLDNQQILDAMMELDVEKWKYNGEDESHIGCYAEDFNERFGIKDKKTIDVVDIIGVLMASIQAQQAQLEELKGKS